ncbi:unnamed protein product [Discula destructiva]
MPLQTCEDRPYPGLIFRAVSGERTPGAALALSKTRWCTVDTPDGLSEMIQSVVSTDDASLYLAFQPEGHLLTIHVHPTDKVYLIDLQRLSGTEALELCQTFSTAQLHAMTTTPPSRPDNTHEDVDNNNNNNNNNNNDSAHPERDHGSLLDFGRLPSLRSLLESAAIAKVIFDAPKTVRALHMAYGVALGGVQDIQLAELAGRPLRIVLFHRMDVGRRTAALRTLRCCLE